MLLWQYLLFGLGLPSKFKNQLLIWTWLLAFWCGGNGFNGPFIQVCIIFTPKRVIPKGWPSSLDSIKWISEPPTHGCIFLCIWILVILVQITSPTWLQQAHQTPSKTYKAWATQGNCHTHIPAILINRIPVPLKSSPLFRDLNPLLRPSASLWGSYELLTDQRPCIKSSLPFNEGGGNVLGAP